MGTESLEYALWETDYFGKQLKNIFGNRKNYYRFLAERSWKRWNFWLINLGYR